MVTVTITVIEARKLRDVQILGIQDPFVIISTDKESRQTKTDNNGGTRPYWNDVKTLNCRNYEGVLVFKIMNKNIIKDSEIDSGTLSMPKIASYGGYIDTWVPLASGGELHVIVKLDNCKNVVGVLYFSCGS
ncbi:uncharacterized protein [Blastocystis hominis]|uniref:C2 domain-containing protein n=1 Tax=Blastocystis hominis TaxID=12968 RepID=D8M1T6_BLAHO|nr:uncharacterized protein [Blastocystis hominis]CBK22025.2 unnamed protein product [Blastocystis hominis]|eukprot:XP_012896073.1 uncharacterized protein [Blastocystis hominis]